jgi:hypothetical protein
VAADLDLVVPPAQELQLAVPNGSGTKRSAVRALRPT